MVGSKLLPSWPTRSHIMVKSPLNSNNVEIVAAPLAAVRFAVGASFDAVAGSFSRYFRFAAVVDIIILIIIIPVVLISEGS